MCNLREAFSAKETTNASHPDLHAVTILLPVSGKRCCQAASVKILRSLGLPIFVNPAYFCFLLEPLEYSLEISPKKLMNEPAVLNLLKSQTLRVKHGR
ncbi:hypothetical protein LEP1GSC191_0847 [Leptospira borgpetersenii serovar Mini str. 201000851]|uniref:Uncharacterized protein n=2 Tax=Leptospira borgpetersenii TaxID=174 RepID=M3HUJ1_LEPBO|nr:hypothetical protein LEP1GSC128_4078 [Leptospira borgpetersenii str. 200801926]EMG01726.1 hypothetical protein LEP1GSC123_0048 [Leptospira borgpetersenii str. 200701203]ENO64677.1 hypothetical protein LEP1GSC191_0847 [Leptospira borgpetersenii serovar Mini str. 201000851]